MEQCCYTIERCGMAGYLASLSEKKESAVDECRWP